VAVALLLAVASREVRPEIVPSGSTIRLAFGAVRGVMSDPMVRWLFVVYGAVFLGRQMSSQYMTVLIHSVENTTYHVAGSVWLVLGLAPIVGAAVSPVGGWVADRLGFRRVLVGAIAGIAFAFAALSFASTVAVLAVAYSVAIAFQTVVGAMVSSLLATETPPERRSATLNLIYLPLYIGGIAGPAIGAGVVTFGDQAVFYVATGALVVATLLAVAFAKQTGRHGPSGAAHAGAETVTTTEPPF
jgi:predicted MFS family arabinose efflux permease